MAASGANLLKGMKLSRARRSKQFVPGVRSESSHAGKARLNVAELNRTDQSGKVSAEGPQTRINAPLLANADNQKDRCARQRTDHRLGKNDLV